MSAAPSPVGTNKVVEWLVSAGSSVDCVCGWVVVAKLDVWLGENWLYQGWSDDGCPGVCFVAGEMLSDVSWY